MRKTILGPTTSSSPNSDAEWFDLENSALVEVTSEDPDYPIEAALGRGNGPGWRASGPGSQVIRLQFDVPQRIRSIRVVFEETEAERTQEFVLKCSVSGQPGAKELFRQQYNFSPSGATRQVENFTTDLTGVSSLELSIVPDIGGGSHVASLAELRVG